MDEAEMKTLLIYADIKDMQIRLKLGEQRVSITVEELFRIFREELDRERDGGEEDERLRP
jgi:hypothetical protein